MAPHPTVRRLSYDQSNRQHRYQVEGPEGAFHLTITDPHSPYSGDEHTLEFSECDCAATVTPSTPTGEDGDGTQTDEEGSDRP